MDELKDRIRTVRKQSQFKTQESFASALGTTRPAIASYELGKVVPSETFIQLLCSKFHISEKWLRTGEGSMKSESDEDMLDRIARELSLTPLQSEAFHYLMSLPDEERETVAKAFFILLKGNKKPAGRKESCPPETEADVKRKIVNAELDAEAKGKTS